MAKYLTADGVEVSAAQKSRKVTILNEDSGAPYEVAEAYWEIKFPDGSIRESHPSAFDSQFKEI